MRDTVDQLRILLIDPSGARWTDDELVDYINRGVRVLLTAYPQATAQVMELPLDEGAYQKPANVYRVEEVHTSVGYTGGQPDPKKTYPVTPVDRDVLDTTTPGWTLEKQQERVEHWMLDERNPAVFWVYPPNNGTGHVQATVCVIPAEAAIGQAFPLDEQYREPVLHYAAHLAYLKDDDAGDTGRSGTHLHLFEQRLAVYTGKVNADMQTKARESGRPEP